VDKKLVPDVFDLREVLCVDVAVESLFVVVESLFDLILLFISFTDEFENVNLIVVYLDKPLPDFIFLLFSSGAVISVSEGTKCYRVLSVGEQPRAEKFHNSPFSVVIEKIYELYEVGIINKVLFERDDARNIEGNDAVFGMAQMLITEFLYFNPVYPVDVVEKK
jgi:hypothetical protein